MKLATWNINSLNVRLPQLLDWLQANPVDAIGLQELKLTDDKFPFMELEAAGYQAVCHGQKTYNGVAILSRHPMQDVVRNIPGLDDEQARVIAATLQTPQGPVRLINCYFVNGQAPDSDKFAYKLRWLAALEAFVQAEMAQHPQLALVGDFNVAPEDRDSYDPEGLRGTIHHTPEERAHFQRLLDLGLTDAFRMFEQEDKLFSWWDYRMFGFKRNAGLRIDHIMLSPELAKLCESCHIDRVPRTWEQPSDHTPVVAALRRA
jgi:exodeoxyribonuclease-3